MISFFDFYAGMKLTQQVFIFFDLGKLVDDPAEGQVAAAYAHVQFFKVFEFKVFGQVSQVDIRQPPNGAVLYPG